MNLVLQNEKRALISFDLADLVRLCDALRDVQSEESLSVVNDFLTKIENGLARSRHKSNERTDVWPDGASVQMICVTAFGDPIDMGADEARELASRLNAAIEMAEK